ncbi:MAG: hypothetical protein F4X56_08435 [Gammaproteobacteria bacterium]|nr:McrC family protein [Gammaproteobacteria bacterium]MYC25926.1 hypothetical protein [Gammaproteobacteria bacterium]
MLWVPEYGRVVRGSVNRNLPSGNLELTSSDFDAVSTLLEISNTDRLNSIFQYSKKDGVDCLWVQNYVGVIRTESDCQFEILPKISKKVAVESARDLLVRMLVELQSSRVKQGTVADLQAFNLPILEVVLRYFLEQTTNVVRQGIARTYVEVQDNVVFLRGKLQLSEHLKRNLIHRSSFYCEYDEFEVNRPINRLIKRALEIINRVSRDARNLQTCRELMFWFDRVPASTNVDQDFRAVRQDRLVQHYALAMPTCRLILKELNPLSQQGEHRTMSLLFDMNTVFQDYVVAKLGERLSDWEITAQASGKHLVESIDGVPKFALKPDIELRNRLSGLHFIADCKWKLVDLEKRTCGISQADMYQLYAYCKKCLPDQENKCVLLIYPKTDEFLAPLGPFYFDKHFKHRLFALPFDLNNDCLILPSLGLEDVNLMRLVA